MTHAFAFFTTRTSLEYIQGQLGGPPFQYDTDAPGAEATKTSKGERWRRYYRCASHLFTKKEEGGPVCKVQLVFQSEPGNRQRWLLDERRSHYEHSEDCLGTFASIQAKRKQNNQPPLAFRANVTLLVRD